MVLGQVTEAPASYSPDTPKMPLAPHQSAGASYVAFCPQTPSRPRVYPSLKLARMRGEIARRKPGLAHQEEEVCTLDNVEVCHDHEPRWFVDPAVDSREGAKIFAAGITCCHHAPPFLAADICAGNG